MLVMVMVMPVMMMAIVIAMDDERAFLHFRGKYVCTSVLEWNEAETPTSNL